MTLRATYHILPAAAQALLSQTLKSFQATVSVVRNSQAKISKIQNFQIGFKRYHLGFTWQSFDEIYQQQPELLPLLNRAESSYQAAARITKLLAASDRIALPQAGTRFYIPFKVVASFIWYVEAVATEQGWQVVVREPISRSAPCPYVIFQAV